jgi:uncharacterized membrane protein
MGATIDSIPLMVIGSLLMLIGILCSIYYSISFSQAEFLYLDHPDMPVKELLKESIRMMRGNKLRYFYLQLSFIGMMLLVVLTCGIGYLWVAPYKDTTLILFYEELMENQRRSE